MRKTGRVPRELWPLNACQHRGRVLCFSQSGGKLRVIEIVLGDGTEIVDVQTDADCRTERICDAGCCSFGDRVLMMAEEGGDVFAALVGVDEGRLSEGTLHVTTLAVDGTYWG